jgi:hypothetical protein
VEADISMLHPLNQSIYELVSTIDHQPPAAFSLLISKIAIPFFFYKWVHSIHPLLKLFQQLL